MNSPQPFKFQSLEQFFDHLPAHEREIVIVLREIILASIPDCREKLSYNVPYYSRKRRICFIWPASVPWGGVQLNGVQLGFCQGYRLNDPAAYLEKGNRKQVYTRTFHDLAEVDLDLLQGYLRQAAEFDR